MNGKKIHYRSSLFVSLPDDCIGEIMTYIHKSQDALSILRVSKELNHLLQKENFFGTRNVLFRITRESKPPNDSRTTGTNDSKDENFLNYVRKVKLECFVRRRIAYTILLKCPLIENLDISQNIMIDDSCLFHLTNLKILDISSCRRINGDIFHSKCICNLKTLMISRENLKRINHERMETFNSLKSLTCLKFVHDPSHRLSPPMITKSLMGQFPSSKILEIHAKQSKLSNGAIFNHQKNLRYLDISRCNSNTRCNVTDELLRDLRSLIVLKINNIQYSRCSRFSHENKDPMKPTCGNLSIEAFRHMHLLEHLEIDHNWDLNPEIISRSTLPNLRILHARSCSEAMFVKILEILDHLDKVKICGCEPHNPILENRHNHYTKYISLPEILEGNMRNAVLSAFNKNEHFHDRRKVTYTCDKCKKCDRCSNVIKPPNDRFRCGGECGKLICSSKTCEGGTCELCGGCFCRDCRSMKMSFDDICSESCEYNMLCNRCLESQFLKCEICRKVTVCKKCGKMCKTCGKVVCWDCNRSKYCECCECEIESDADECEDCFEPVQCKVCMSTRSNYYQFHQCQVPTLCEDCAGVCLLCEEVVCVGGDERSCVMSCDVCKRTGCITCLNDGKEPYYGYCELCGICFCSDCRNQPHGGVIYCEICEGVNLGCSQCCDEKSKIVCYSSDDNARFACDGCLEKAQNCEVCKILVCFCDECCNEDESSVEEVKICKYCKMQRMKKKDMKDDEK